MKEKISVYILEDDILQVTSIFTFKDKVNSSVLENLIIDFSNIINDGGF